MLPDNRVALKPFLVLTAEHILLNYFFNSFINMTGKGLY
jgi:hypothetical protein